ncbi:hypothetical protein RYX36_002953 [Vicia faba]
MVNSVFYDVINIQNNKESSSIFIKLFGDFYDPTNRRFVLNNNTSFSFCAKEVADVLGIENTGPDFNAPAAKKVPQFVKDLVIGYGVDSSGKISTTTIKELLKKMNVDDEESRLNFKKVLCYFLIEMFLIPSPDPKKPRTGSWSMVEDLDVYEKVNWAKAIYEDLHESFNKLKTATVGKQHNFKACAPVFEAVVFERIPSLKPNLSSYPYPPIQKYDAKRKDWELLKSIKADEITPCSYCGDGVEGDASPSPSSLIPANVVEDFLASGAEDDSASSLNVVEDFLASGAEDDSASSLNVAKDSLASGAEDDSASSLNVAKESLASSLVDDVCSLCLNDASAQPSSPVKALRRSTRPRKQNLKYSPSEYK